MSASSPSAPAEELTLVEAAAEDYAEEEALEARTAVGVAAKIDYMDPIKRESRSLSTRLLWAEKRPTMRTTT